MSLAKGLPTLAYLKSQLETGRDHLSMFEPVIADSVQSHENSDFSVHDIQVQVKTRTGIYVPAGYIETLLGRLARKRHLERTGGRYVRLRVDGLESNFEAHKTRLQGELLKLGDALSDFVQREGGHSDELPPDQALEVLAEFVREHRVTLLLNEADLSESQSRTKRQRRLERLLARFITEVCLGSGAFRERLKGLLEGLVLQDVLLLRDVAYPEQRFRDLIVAIDTHVVLALVGLLGQANEGTTSEGLDLLRACGAQVIVFNDTLDEVGRILAVYQEKMASHEGRLSLHPTPLTQHMLRARMSPVDIRYARATIPARLHQRGVTISERPPRDPRFTLDEQELAKRLTSSRDGDAASPRIWHDVNCIAAVLTYRRSRMSSSVERSRALFSTTSRRVIRTINAWFDEQTQGTSVPPAIHHERLTSIAWLKRPAAAPDLKLHELAVVCNAIMRPTRETWDACIAELRRLRDDGLVTNDETSAIVASELLEPVLAAIEDLEEPQADTLQQALERVREETRRQAEERDQSDVLRARQIAEEATEKVLRLEGAVSRRTKQIGAFAASTIHLLLLCTILLGAYFAYPWVDQLAGTRIPALLKQLAVFVLAIAGFLGIVWGFNLQSLRSKLTLWLESAIRRWWFKD